MGLLALAALFSAGKHISPQPVTATAVCNQITSNTTWTVANSPYDVCNTGITVLAGVTLTIQPGVTVEFENGVGSLFSIQGAVVANGTAAQPISFSGVVTTPVSWAGISVNGTVATNASLSLDYATLNYGGVNGSFGAEVYADRASVTIHHSLIENSAGNGI